MASYGSDTLATISQDGVVPASRMKDARQVQDFFRRLVDNDSRRSFKRSRVNGLVDGNPPYKASRLREAGRAEACNVNWGTARSYLEASAGAFYDLFSESPGYITFKTAYGLPEQQEDWSNIASAEADLILKDRTVMVGKKRMPAWDYQMQISQWDMVLHGCGPFIFEDADTILPKAALCGDLKVPEFTKSDTSEWEACGVQSTYYPPKLYSFIENEEAATAAGWDVEYTKLVIANAMDIRQQAGIQYEWEFFQQELKNNSLTYYDDSKICRLAHVFWQEFDGRITHAIVERDSSDGLEVKYLYLHVGRYKSFQECLHPMYFDHGNGGYHHSVTGLGVKMYSAMEYENRLICNLCDKAFAPKILFKPTTAESSQKFSMVMMGDYAVLPKGFEPEQGAVAGMMNDGLAMHGSITQIMQGNLSAYRQSVPDQKSGNPVTKFEKMLQAEQQSALNKTQFNRYYEQYDMLVAEIWRRLSNPNSTDERAIRFQKKCAERGVPIEALCRVAYVGATRVVGQGSAFMRKQAIDSLFPIAGSLPEDGRDNLIADKIAAEAGQSAVARYYPKKKQTLATDQQAEALQWVAAMKVGVPPVVTSSQNPVTYAATFLKAATDALQSLQQGGNPMDVLRFLNIAGPAIAAQIGRFEQDPTRAEVAKALTEQWHQLASVTDQLKQQLQQQMQQQQQQQEKTQGAMTDEQIAQQKAQSDIAIKQAKTQATMKQSQEKHDLKMRQGMQNLALSDATTAAEIHRNNLKAVSTAGE